MLAATASAQQTHAAKSQVINAGVVILDSSKSATPGSYPVSAAPHVWYNLDNNRSIKPVAWNLNNPHASTVLTGSLYDRWNWIETGLGNPALVEGSRISKRNAAYWEVRLSDLTDTQISDYDVLVVSPLFGVQLSPVEREKLRHFVDRGGVLWIDPAGLPATTGIDQGNSFPVPFALSAASTGPEIRDFTQPLLTTPQALSDRDFAALSSTAVSSPFERDIIQPTAASLGSPNLFGDSVAEFQRIKPVVGANVNQYSVGVARIGNGFVVITGRGASLKLNRVQTLNPDGSQSYALDANWGYTARTPILQADGLAAARLAVNMISLVRESSQPQGGSQKNSSSAVDIGAPLLRRSSDDRVVGSQTHPVVYKGFVVVSAGDTIQVYDADPERDIDGDGNPNDGDQNDGGLSGRDLVWQSTSLGSGLSSPVCAEIPNSSFTRADGSRITDMVVAVNSAGSLCALDLMPYANGRISGGPISPIVASVAPAGAGTTSQPASGVYQGQTLAPTVHEGIAYIAEPISGNSSGRIWMVNLANMARYPGNAGTDWFYGAGKGGLPPFSAPPTIGYIPILDNSGGQDKVLYAPTARSTGLGATPAGFVSVWLGTKGERPTSYEEVGGNLVITTRAAGSQLPIYLANNVNDPNNVRITLVRADGSVYSAAQTSTVLDGTVTQAQGVLTATLRNGALPTDVTGVRVDYSIDLGADANDLTNLVRGNIQLPDNPTTPVRDIMGSIALSPRGTLFMTNSQTGGSRATIYAYREEGRGAFKCVLRYDLFGSYTMIGQGVSTQVNPVFSDNDPVTNFAPAFLQQPFTRFTIAGPPAIRGDVAFVVAAAYKNGVIPASIIMAFPSDPAEPSIRLDNFPTGSVLVQPDLARSTVASRPEIVNVYNPAQIAGMVYDEDSKLLKMDSLTTSQKNQQQAVLSLSQPIMIRVAGSTTDQPYIPDEHDGNTFDPLLWYTVLNGFEATSSGLAITGNTLFTTGTSRVRSVLSSGAISPAEGMMYALDTNISSNNEFLTPMIGAPWRQQLCLLKVDGSGLKGNPAQRWPQVAGVNDLDDYLVRLSQTVVPNSEPTGSNPAVFGMAAGEGILALTSVSGLHTYSRADFYVADQGRIAIFDPAGNPTFTLGASASTGEDRTGNAGKVIPLVNPTRAYPMDDGSILVVDAGKDRIFRVDKAGIESRSIEAMRLDPNVRPQGYPSNGPLLLKAPRDVCYYTSIADSATISQYVTPAGSPYEIWYHYLIADSGNHRLIELIDRYAYDPVARSVGPVIRLNGESQLGVLLWHSPSTVESKNFAYNSVARVYVNGRFVYFAGVGGAMPTNADVGGAAPTPTTPRTTAGYGGVAVFDPLNPAGVVAFHDVNLPYATADNIFWNASAGAFASIGTPADTRRPLVDVRSVTARTINDNGTQRVLVMISDANGVTEVEYAPGTTPNVTWMLPREAYKAMRRDGSNVPIATNPGDLKATYARRLDTGDVLVVNGYFGQTLGTRNPNGTYSNRSPFRGEVIQVNGQIDPSRYSSVNMGFGVRSITFSLELVSDTRGLVLPVFADRR